MIITLRPEQVDLFWPMVADGIGKACAEAGSDVSAGYLWQECRSGRMFLVIAQQGAKVECAWVFRFDTWASGIKLRCIAAGGEGMSHWLEDIKKHVGEMQRQGGANGVVADGRMGWQRVFPDSRVVRTLIEVDWANGG
jgi:hypothetical protein